jgi:uncharacterized protein (TIGR02466 family)
MQLNQIFPVPIYENMVGDENIQFEFDTLVAELKRDDKFQYNPVSECQLLSDTTFTENLFDTNKLNRFKHVLIENVQEYIKMVVPEYVTNRNYDFRIDSSWLTLNCKNHYSHSHHHGDADISGVYYVKTDGNDGDLVFENPNRLISTSYLLNTWQEALHHKPQVGKLILFPGWMVHRVEKNPKDSERISFSFNIMFNRGKNENS